MEKQIEELISAFVKDRGVLGVNLIQRMLQRIAGTEWAPVGAVLWVPIEKVKANDYNPNSVAKNELRLLYISIKNDGFTQPVVTIYDEEKDTYVIVDGFHRYYTMLNNKDILDRAGGMLPIVVIDKPIKDRMASTVRHNRARGKHSVDGMGYLVMELRNKGWDAARICNEIGLEPDELVRLEHTSGVADMFKDVDYGRSWEESSAILGRKGKGTQ